MNTLRDIWEDWGFAIIGALIAALVFVGAPILGLLSVWGGQ